MALLVRAISAGEDDLGGCSAAQPRKTIIPFPFDLGSVTISDEIMKWAQGKVERGPTRGGLAMCRAVKRALDNAETVF